MFLHSASREFPDLVSVVNLMIKCTLSYYCYMATEVIRHYNANNKSEEGTCIKEIVRCKFVSSDFKQVVRGYTVRFRSLG